MTEVIKKQYLRITLGIFTILFSYIPVFAASIPPAAISNLTAIAGSVPGTVKLKWTAPGDDGTGGGNVSSYEVKYATKYIGTSDYATSWVSTYSQNWTPAVFGTEEGATGNRVVSGLEQGTTYWFAVKARDDMGQWSSWTSSGTVNWVNTLNSTMTVFVPNIPPAAVSNLTALSQGTGLGGQITLKWTAPGDDGTGGGNVTSYEVKYATSYISPSDYNAGWVNTYPQGWTPCAFGTEDIHILSGFSESATYYFAVKSYDGDDWAVWTGTSSVLSPYVNPDSFNFATSSSPAPVNDFSAQTGSGAGEIDLTWTSPGDDGTTGDLVSGSQFLIKYSTVSSDGWASMDYEWYISTAVSQGVVNSQTVTGLTEGTTYYFYIKTSDESGLWSPLSNKATSWAAFNPSGQSNGLLTDAAHDWSFENDSAPKWTYTPTGTPVYGYTFQKLDRSKSFTWASVATTFDSRELFMDDFVTGIVANSSNTVSVNWLTTSAANLAAQKMRYIVEWYDSGDALISMSTSTEFSLSATNAWELKTSTFTSPFNVSKAKIRIQSRYDSGAGNSGRHCFDAIGFWAVLGDAVAPCPVSNLTALSQGTGLGSQITLKWTAPGADGTGSGDVNSYEVKYATSYISPADYNAGWVNTYLQDWTPGSFGTEESRLLTGLDEGTTYYFALKATDGNYWSVWPGTSPTVNSQNFALPTSSAPATVNNFTAVSGPVGGEVELTWTAPGDDGTTGRLSSATVHIKYSDNDSDGWAAMPNDIFISTSVNALTVCSYGVTGLTEGVTYYFYVKTGDEKPNWSPLSDKTTAMAKITPPPAPNGLLFYDIHDWSFENSSTPKWIYTASGAEYGSTSQQADRNRSFKWSTLATNWGNKEIVTDEFIAGLVSNSSHTAGIQWLSSSVAFAEIRMRFIVEWYDYSNALISKSTGTEYSLSAIYNWETVSSTFTSPGGTRKAKLMIQAKNAGSSTVVYFDAAGFWAGDWDSTPPAAVSNLTALGPSGAGLGGQVTLKWTAPGSDGTGKENIYSYEVKYATKYISAEDYEAGWANTYPQNWLPVNFGSEELHILTGFAEAATYFFAIKGCDERNWGVWPGTSPVVNSQSFNFATSSAPAPVNDFSAQTGLENGEIALSWTAPGDDGTVGALTAGSQFLIKYSSTVSYDWETMNYNWYISTAVAQGTVNSLTVTGLIEETSYYFYIKTADEAGIWSPLSNKTTAYSVDGVAPNPVTDFASVTGAQGGTIELKWTSPGDDGTLGNISGGAYLIKYSSDPVDGWATMDYSWYISTDTAAGVKNSFIITGLAQSDTYYFYIETADEKPNWSALSNLTSSWAQIIYDILSPAAVSNLTALNDGTGLGGQITLKWTAPGDDGTGGGNVDYFTVKYSSNYIGSENWDASWVTTWGNISASVAFGSEELHILTGFSEGTTYWFALKAYDGTNWSVWPGTTAVINEDSFSLPTSSAPAPVNSLSAVTGSSPGEINLKWTAPGDDGTTGAITGGKFAIRYATYTTIDWSTASSEWTDFDDKYELGIDTDTNDYNEVHSRTMTSLHEGVTYYFRIKTADEQPNWSALSNSATAYAAFDLIPPSAVSNLTALAAGSNLGGRIQLKWTAPGDDGASGGNAAFFTVKYSSNYISSADWNAGWVSVWGNISTSTAYGGEEIHLLTGFDEGTTYYFAIITVDEAENRSVWPGTTTVINEDSFSLPTSSAPAPVNDFYAVQGSSGGEIDLVWTSPGDDGTTGGLVSGSQFLIKYSSVSSDGWASMDYEWYISTVVAQGVVNSLTVTGLLNQTSYYFYIKTADEAGYWSPSSNKTTAFTLPSAPQPPAGFNAINRTATSIKWGWGNVANEEGYKVYSDTGGVVADLSADTTYYLETGLSVNTSYQRYAEAFNAGGISSSTLAGEWTLAVVPSFTGITVTSVTASINWSAQGNPSFTRYALSLSSDNFSQFISTFIFLGDNLMALSTVAYNLSVNTSYYFRVWAYNEVDEGTVFASTGPVLTDKTYPTAPSAISGLTISTSTIRWSWQDALYEDGYYIYSSTGGNPLTSLAADATFWIQTGLAPNTSFFASVTAWNNYLGGSTASESAPSVVFTYQMPPVTGSPPVVSSTTVTISWSGVSQAKYRIERDGVFLATATAASINPSYNDPGLSPGTTYDYGVYSLNENGQWDASSGINIPAATLAVYTISGTLTDSAGAAISGSTVILSGSASAVVLTNNSGNYTFINLVPGDYTVTPSTENYTFSPVSRSTSSLSVDINNWNFIGAGRESVPVIETGKPGFVTVDYPLIFGADVTGIAVYSPSGKKILDINGNVWYGTENNSPPASASALLESGAYIYKAKTSSGGTNYGTVVIVK